LNKNGTKTIEEACLSHRPFWYSLNPKTAHIVTAINPYKRLFFSYSKNSFAIDQRLVAINVNEQYDIKLIAALLNSVISLLTVELKGTSRNLGALDLNANYFKKLRILNPNNLTLLQKDEIIESFNILTHREILEVIDEVEMQDRIDFDKTILRAYNIDETILPRFYDLLVASVYERVSLSEE